LGEVDEPPPRIRSCGDFENKTDRRKLGHTRHFGAEMTIL